jgi:hypothetical protein
LIDRALPWLWWLGAPVLAGVILFLAGRDAVPAFTAQFGSGVPGAFTATERNCGRSCTFQGDFISDDGSLIRRDVAVLGTVSVITLAGWAWSVKRASRRGRA